MTNKVKVLIDLPEIKGYEYTGEYRPARKGEHIALFDGSGSAWHCICGQDSPNFIVRRPRWRAEGGDIVYWFLSSSAEILFRRDQRECVDNSRWAIGNYFKTEMLAEHAQQTLIEEFLKLQHEVTE